MRLTKQEAISWHRKMWRWIAKQYKAGRTDWIINLKTEYCYKRKLSVFQNCFCCEYAIKQRWNEDDEYCVNCPVIWGTEEETQDCCCKNKEPTESPYWKLYKSTNPNSTEKISTEEAYKLALQIAELPEKRQNNG